MSIPAIDSVTSHPISGDNAYVYDYTAERKITICNSQSQILAWKGMHIYVETVAGQLQALNYSKESLTQYVQVIDGKKTGQIVLFRKEIEKEGIPTNDSFLELNSQIVSWIKESKIIDLTGAKTYKKTPIFIAKQVESVIASESATIDIVASFPVDESDLSNELKYLLNSMVSGSLLESEQHEIQMKKSDTYQAIFQEKSSRVHFFQDQNVCLFDCTKMKIAGITYQPHPVMAEAITLNGKAVRNVFGQRYTLSGDTFTKTAPGYTSYVVVRDEPNHSVSIHRKEVLRPGAKECETETAYVDLDESNASPLHRCNHCVSSNENPMVYEAQSKPISRMQAAE